MRRRTLMLTLFTLVALLSIISGLSNILTGYPESSRKGQGEQPGNGEDNSHSRLLFRVTPAIPRLYWSISTADYYNGFNWIKTTSEDECDEFPNSQIENATVVFNVEVETVDAKTLLPLPSPDSVPENIFSKPIHALKFKTDSLANTYEIERLGRTEAIGLSYSVSWRDLSIDEKLVSMDGVPLDILNKYLQLPDIPVRVWELAENLTDASLSVYDQILADVQFLRSNFVYDEDAAQYYSYADESQGSSVSSYLDSRRGICLDAATALTVLLRMQEIPARISFGFKPGNIEEDKLLYYTTEAHTVTEVYLPPYGWVQFDATPPDDYDPLIKVMTFKQAASPGNTVSFEFSITNRRNVTDVFKLLVQSRQKWKVTAIPAEVRIEPSQSSYALVDVSVPADAESGEKDLITLTVSSRNQPRIAFSIWVVTQVENAPPSTTVTMIQMTNESVIRGHTFWINGTVLTGIDAGVNNMTVFAFLTKNTEVEGIIVGRGYAIHGKLQIENRIPLSTEIGDYEIVLISLGTTQYAMSRASFALKVRATTRLGFGLEEEYLLGHGAIRGGLQWENGTGYANAPISITISSLDDTSNVWTFANQTTKSGNIRIENTLFEKPGTYEIRAVFLGDEFTLGSEATRNATLRRGEASLQFSSEDIAIRGEVFTIRGTVQFEDNMIWGESVEVAFDDRHLTTIETLSNGTFRASFTINSNEKLGLHVLNATLEKGGTSFARWVNLESKTVLTTEVTDVAGGMFLLVSAALTDDQNHPIEGAQISIRDYALSWKTGVNGNLTFLLDMVKLWPENIGLVTEFEGSELYLPAKMQKDIVLDPLVSLPFLIPLVSSIAVAMVFVYDRHEVERRKARGQTSDLKMFKKPVMIKAETLTIPLEPQLLRIIFQDISDPLPNVWGVNDELRMEIVLDKSISETLDHEVTVLVNDQSMASLTLSEQWCAELSHVFSEKGEQKVRAILPRTPEHQGLDTEVKVRIVNYAEETVRLYNIFLQKMDIADIPMRNEKTAREIERLIQKSGGFDAKAISKVTTCFEKAEYSDHLVTRKDYENMYLCLKELNINVK